MADCRRCKHFVPLEEMPIDLIERANEWLDGLEHQVQAKPDGLAVSMQLNDDVRTSESFSSQLQTKPCEKDQSGLGEQVRAKRRSKRSKRSSWEVEAYLKDLVMKIEFIVEELDQLLSTVLPDLCRLAKEFSELPEPRWGSTRVKAKGREYEYSVLYLLEGSEFVKAKKIYLASDKRRELAARYEHLYRKIAGLLRAARVYCQGLGLQEPAKPSSRSYTQGLELQGMAKPREEDHNRLALPVTLNEEEFFEDE